MNDIGQLFLTVLVNVIHAKLLSKQHIYLNRYDSILLAENILVLNVNKNIILFIKKKTLLHIHLVVTQLQMRKYIVIISIIIHFSHAIFHVNPVKMKILVVPAKKVFILK